ncbi:hypothetical protein RO02_11915 [Fusobacterium polymorphum]|uniref:Polypeptide-transport-associated ShlB-type domain-containing protein n=2 Tax=Fusobacterium TaxID=848 RepID=A0AAC8WHF7_FUSNP|nr:POTRA domain-containing protein [Fusobacterium polymorphum]ALM95240.1 hypothetical protein RO02_11915 [Fusobacterium polymorphum]
MFRKIFLLSLLTFSFSYAVDEIDIEKRRQEQQDFDNLIKSQNFSVPKSSEDNEQKNLILNVNSINLEGNTIFEDFQIDALLKKYIGKNRDIYALINELENKYIERGYVTAKVGLNTEVVCQIVLIKKFTYAVDEIDIEKRRQEQQDFDNLIKSQNFSVPKSSEDNEQKNLILNVNSINLEGNTIFEDFQIDALLKKYIGKNRDIYALINELENKYIERGYVTAKVGLNTEKSDFNNGNISLFVLEGKIDKVFYDDKENKFKTLITWLFVK